MGAGVHAARDPQIERADVAHVIGVGEAGLDGGGQSQRIAVRQIALARAGAGDQIGEQTAIGSIETEGVHVLPEREQPVLADLGQQ